MKIKNKFTGLILCLALSAASLTGCGGEKASEPVRSEAVQDTAKTDKKADTVVHLHRYSKVPCLHPIFH